MRILILIACLAFEADGTVYIAKLAETTNNLVKGKSTITTDQWRIDELYDSRGMTNILLADKWGESVCRAEFQFKSSELHNQGLSRIRDNDGRIVDPVFTSNLMERIIDKYFPSLLFRPSAPCIQPFRGEMQRPTKIFEKKLLDKKIELKCEWKDDSDGLTNIIIEIHRKCRDDINSDGCKKRLSAICYNALQIRGAIKELLNLRV